LPACLPVHGPAAHDGADGEGAFDEGLGGLMHAQTDGIERGGQVLRLNCAEPARTPTGLVNAERVRRWFAIRSSAMSLRSITD
jgi:hypothetical protein